MPHALKALTHEIEPQIFQTREEALAFAGPDSRGRIALTACNRVAQALRTV